MPDPADVTIDIDALISGFALHGIRRFMGQAHWLEETGAARAADRAEPLPRLESVAAHSWHVAEGVMLLAAHFPELDLAHCLKLALLHDRLEAYTGDYDPIGEDGQGTTTHAFDPAAQRQKAEEEREALARHLDTLRPALRAEHEALYHEIIDAETPNARFVMAVDKLQALAFVICKKQGRFTEEHLAFTHRYSRKTVEYWPGLQAHYDELVRRLGESVEGCARIGVVEIIS